MAVVFEKVCVNYRKNAIFAKTEIKALDNVSLTVPHGAVYGNIIINYITFKLHKFKFTKFKAFWAHLGVERLQHCLVVLEFKNRPLEKF